jgi:hypothetical protein
MRLEFFIYNKQLKQISDGMANQNPDKENIENFKSICRNIS